MLDLDVDHVRVFLHVMAAAVWVGGQVVLAGLLPTVRSLGPDAPATVARRFNRIAWPAFAVAVATGIWNLFEVGFADRSAEYQVTLFVKLAVVALSGVAAAVHVVARRRSLVALGGAVGFLAALGTVLLGVQLGG